MRRMPERLMERLYGKTTTLTEGLSFLLITVRCPHHTPNMLLTLLRQERVEGKDYSQGWKTYAFAAPFSDRGLNLTSEAKSAAVL